MTSDALLQYVAYKRETWLEQVNGGMLHFLSNGVIVTNSVP